MPCETFNLTPFQHVFCKAGDIDQIQSNLVLEHKRSEFSEISYQINKSSGFSLFVIDEVQCLQASQLSKATAKLNFHTMWALTEKMLASRDILVAICTHNRKLNTIVSTYGHGKVYELTTAHNVTAGHTEFVPIEGTALD